MRKNVTQTICDASGAIKPDGATGWVTIGGIDLCPEWAGKSATEITAGIAAKQAADQKAEQDRQQALQAQRISDRDARLAALKAQQEAASKPTTPA